MAPLVGSARLAKEGENSSTLTNCRRTKRNERPAKKSNRFQLTRYFVASTATAGKRAPVISVILYL
jgi:hypothetical protein